MQARLSLLAFVATLALSGCGGSGGDDTVPATSGGTGASITVTGSAAAAAALTSRSVQVKCKAGTHTATTDADGRYSAEISGGAFPCVIRVRLADDSTLHSVAAEGTTTTTTTTATANVTPLTELTVAQVSGSAPATYFDGGFAASGGSAVTSAAVTSAATQVVATLASAGIDTSTITNPVTDALVPSGATSGTANGYGQVLAAFDAKLQSTGTTLSALTSAVTAASPAATTAASTAPSLPAAQLLSDKAANCSALRSGIYRAVYNGTDAPELVTLNAATLTGTTSTGGGFTLTANGNCRYRTAEGGDVVVSSGGVIFGQANAAPFQGAVLFPEQTHGLAAAVGTIDFLALDRVGSNARPQLTSFTLTVDAAGDVQRGTVCETVTGSCSSFNKGDAGAPAIRVVVGTNGGLRVENPGVSSDPLFIYQTGGGEKMYVLANDDGNGHIAFGTRNADRVLPTVGTVSESWNLSLVPNATAPFYTAPASIGESKNTIFSVDAAAASYVRDAVVNFATGVTVPETIQLNVPRSGYLRRVPGAATASDGSARTVGEWVALGLRGTGMSAVGIIGNQNLLLSAAKAE